jgi:hypothetical protein
MAQYCVNNQAQANGDHEVHRQGCTYWPRNSNPLGDHTTCQTAVAQAKRIYPRANGCYTCSNACHTS